MTEPRPDRISSESLGPPRTYGPVAPKLSDQELIERLTVERDRYASMLLSAEQELAKSSRGEPDDLEWYRQAYLMVVGSRSWQLTKPLRTCGRFARRARGRTAA